MARAQQQHQHQHQHQLYRALRLSLVVLIAHRYHDNASAFAPSSMAHNPSFSSSCSTMTNVAIKRSLPSIKPYRAVLHSSLQSDTESSEETSSTSSSATQSAQSGMQSLGNKLIMQAALQCGATEPMVDVEWKADRIIVTVDVHKDENYEEDDFDDGIWMGDSLDEELEDIEWDDEEFDDEDFVEEDFDPEALGLEPLPSEEGGSNKIDLTLIARTINELLAEDGEESPKFTIAKMHEIEVTTPEFDNVLRGRVMFENYKGFDVTIEHYEDPKKKKNKQKKGKAQKNDAQNTADDVFDEKKADETTIEPPKLITTEGKLVGRDYEKEVTMINVKGRVVKIKNDLIECVRLPKAKREKGVK